MNRFLTLVTALIIALLMLSGCATSSAGIAPSNIPLTGRKFTVLGPAETTVEWVSVDFGILGWPLESPPMDEAVQNLLEQRKGDAIINIRHWRDQVVLLFYRLNRLHIKADVIKLN